MKSAVKILWVIILLAFLTGCVGTTDFVTRPASQIAVQQSDLYKTILGMAAVVFVIVEGGIIIAVIRFRRKKDEKGEPRQIPGNIPLEIIWTAIPVLLVAILFYFTVSTVNAIAAPPASPGDIKVNVVGHRWWWEFDYPDLKITSAEELYIPVDTPIQISLTSVDVVHSFWVPQLAGKTDAIPGMTNHLWITANQPGTYYGQCSEFCGIEHALMRFKVVALSKADFNAWATRMQQPVSAPQTDLEIQGEKLVVSGVCASCHTIDGTQANGKVGPNLTHLFSWDTFIGASYALNDANLTSWLKNSQSMKPGNLMTVHVSDQDLPAILAFLKTLK